VPRYLLFANLSTSSNKYILNPFFLRFDTVEAAERCIEALRHYRNLHPSFSKVCRVHL
jgi:hypothetical protein